MTNFPDRIINRRVITAAGCWEWLGCKDGCGYGVIAWNGRPRRVHRVVAHLSWKFDLQSDTQILHRCDNPPCFNPDHLYEGGYKENMNDRDSKGRQWQMKKELCANGHLLSGGNLLLKPSNHRPGKFVRHCRECMRTFAREYARKIRSTPEGRKKHCDQVMASYWRKKQNFDLNQLS